MTEPSTSSRFAKTMRELGPLFETAIDKAVEHRWDRAVAAADGASGTSVEERTDALVRAVARELATTGAVAGGTAAVPGIGTGTALATNGGEVGWFALRITDMILAIGVVHGHRHATVEQRRAWLLSVLAFGDDAASEFASVAATLTRSGLGAKATEVASNEWLSVINRKIAGSLIKRWGARRSAMVLGRLLPFGIGAVVGGSTNYAAVRMVANNAREFFREMPAALMAELPPPPTR